jgi:heptosyltransferase-2
MNIAIFCPNWIGDLVMATPALRALQQRFPDARLIGVLKPYVAGVLDGGAWFHQVIYSNGGLWSQGTLAVAWQLRQIRIDIAILFTNSFRTAWTAWLGGSKRIVGYAHDTRGWLLTDRLVPLRDPSGKMAPSPVIDAYNRLAEHLGCSHPGYRMVLHTRREDDEQADRIFRKFGIGNAPFVVALNPGAAYGSAKHWPIEYFADLARQFVEKRGAHVLVLCGPGEQDIARQIVKLAGQSQVVSLADEPVSLGLIKACVRRVDLLVTTDSGPRHFAAAFDRPVITLFGPTHIAWTETYHAKAIHLQKAVECGPCQLRVCPLDHRCMRRLTAQEVFDAGSALLARNPPGAASSTDLIATKSGTRAWGWLSFLRDRKRAS